ncbi:transaldolase family protein [Amphibacillus sp. Q70]|uniref:transaldolase family protein n=1 Tax=Amphibacillus sp. Q70 TaxID=3453416 RepID=UPI003F839656
MEFCLFSFDLKEIEHAKNSFPVDCFAINPTNAVEDLKEAKKSFFENAKLIRKVIGNDSSFFLQVIGHTADEIVNDAIKIKEEIKGNTFVKIPASVEGFKAIKLLKQREIPISCTAIFTLNQAILAAESGADYIAVYVSRLEKLNVSGIDVISKIKKVFDEENYSCKIAAASLKTVDHVEQAILAGADNVTVPNHLLEEMSEYALTQETLDHFKNDWEGLFGKGSRINNMPIR